MGKFIDMTGWIMKEHGVPDSRWTVLSKSTEKINNRPAWLCQCECGNTKIIRGDQIRNGNSKSCGCLQKEKVTKDYTGMVFGRLTVIEPTSEREGSNVIWKCKCSCGNPNYILVSSSNFRKEGGVQSCGCLLKDRLIETHKSKLIREKFGHLTVLEDSGERQHGEVLWLCECDCEAHNRIKVRTGHLKDGTTQSCGCLKSKGEEKIANLLSQANINFQKEKQFSTCILPSGQPARFDFYLPDYNLLIEYDGIQHFQATAGWNNEEKHQEVKLHDNFKNQWCKENNILLIRIPYTDFNNITLNKLLGKEGD